MRTARWERIRSPTSANQRPDQDHYCEPSFRFFSKMLRIFLHLLSGSLAFDGWTLGLSALGEGSSKDTRSGFTPQ